MAAARPLHRFLLKVAWPWFRTYVGPLIRDLVQGVADDFIRELRQHIEVWLAGLQKREANARGRADIESTRADAAADPVEAEKHRQLAQVWRQKAEEYRQENESLKHDVARLLAEGANLREKLGRDIDLRDEGGRPMIGQKPLPLPEPPPGTSPFKCPHCGNEFAT